MSCPYCGESVDPNLGFVGCLNCGWFGSQQQLEKALGLEEEKELPAYLRKEITQIVNKADWMINVAGGVRKYSQDMLNMLCGIGQYSIRTYSFN